MSSSKNIKDFYYFFDYPSNTYSKYYLDTIKTVRTNKAQFAGWFSPENSKLYKFEQFSEIYYLKYFIEDINLNVEEISKLKSEYSQCTINEDIKMHNSNLYALIFWDQVYFIFIDMISISSQLSFYRSSTNLFEILYIDQRKHHMFYFKENESTIYHTITSLDSLNSDSNLKLFESDLFTDSKDIILTHEETWMFEMYETTFNRTFEISSLYEFNTTVTNIVNSTQLSYNLIPRKVSMYNNQSLTANQILLDVLCSLENSTTPINFDILFFDDESHK